ncbi:MAG: hypothetical protein IJ548_03955 [Paludibacteraceae bacterium]|nr:hypothetical protein [Paludibacteraceae bacterium]
MKVQFKLSLVLCGLLMATSSAFGYTAYFHAGAGLLDGQAEKSIAESSDGAGVVLPTPTLSDCSDWEFAGWISSTMPYEASPVMNQPLLAAGTRQVLTAAAEHYYAVYRYKSKVYHDVYVPDQLVSGCKYTILNTNDRQSVYNVHTDHSGTAYLDKLTIGHEYTSWGDGYVALAKTTMADYIPYVLYETNTTNHYWALYYPFLSKYTDFTNCNGIASYTSDADCQIARTDWNTFSFKGVKNDKYLSYGHTNSKDQYFSTKVTSTYGSTCDFYILQQQTVYSSNPDCSSPNYLVSFNAGEKGTGNPTAKRESDYHAGVVLPAATLTSTACTDLWEFAGWTESGSFENTETLSHRLWSVGEVYYPSRDETLHAVYRRKSTAWTRVDDPSTLQAGEKIMIAYKNGEDYYVLSSDEYSTGHNASESVEGAEIISLDNNALVWQLEGTSGAWRLKDANGKHLDLTRDGYACSYTYPWSRWSDEFTITGETDLTLRSNYAGKQFLTADGNMFSATATENNYIHIFRQATVYSRTPFCNTYTIYFNSGEGTFDGDVNATVKVEEVDAIDGIELDDSRVPTPVAPDCDNWKFAGWRVGSGLTATTNGPGVIYKKTGTFVPMREGITLYAVYQKGDGKEYYQKTTNKSEITAGGVYLIVSTTNTKAVTFDEKESQSQWSGENVTVTNDTITGGASTTPQMQWYYDGTKFYRTRGVTTYLLARNNNENYAGAVTGTNPPYKLQYSTSSWWTTTTYYLRWKPSTSWTTYDYFTYEKDEDYNQFNIFKQVSTVAEYSSWPHCIAFDVVLNTCGGKFSTVGDTQELSETTAGAGVDLSSHQPNTECSGWEFVGWEENHTIHARSSEPEDLIAPDATYVPKQDDDQLYAVYKMTGLPIWSSYPACGQNIDIVKWMTDGLVVESYAITTGTPSLNGIQGVANGDGTYTLSYPVAENPCHPLLIEWGSEKQIVQTPMLVTTYSRISAVIGVVDNFEECDVTILGGGTAVVNRTNQEVRNLTIYPKGRLIIEDDKTFTANSLTMRTEGDEAAPVAILGTGGTFTCPTLYHERRIDNARKYWMSLPYDVAISDIDYADRAANGGSKAVYDTDFYLQFYDGVKRATEKGTSSTYWTHIGDITDETYQNKSTLKAGRGYLISLPKKKQANTGHAARTLRFPMTITDNWAAEKNITKTVAAAGADCDWPQHIGWNLIGNPFIQNYTAVTAEDVACGKLTEYYDENGEWVSPWYTLEEGTATVPYITLYDPATDEYTQTELVGQLIAPFSAAFVQLPGEVTGLSFSGSHLSKAAAPARRMRLLNEENETSRLKVYCYAQTEDHFTLILDGRYSQEYEVGADLMKMQNANKLNVYTHHNGVGHVFDAMGYEDADSIPVGFTLPAHDSVTISASAMQIADDVEHVWLIDNELNTWTDLLYDTYTFSSENGTHNNRLWLRIVKAANQTTSIDDVKTNKDGLARKLIYNGQLYLVRDEQIFNAVGTKIK